MKTDKTRQQKKIAKIDWPAGQDLVAYLLK